MRGRWALVALVGLSCRATPKPPRRVTTAAPESPGVLTALTASPLAFAYWRDWLTPRGPDPDEPAGSEFGGFTYSGWAPAPTYLSSASDPYPSQSDDTGTLAGTVRWRQPVAAATLVSPCGPLRVAWPRMGRARGVPAAVVLLENVTSGRSVINTGTPLAWGSGLTIDACALAPFVQVRTSTAPMVEIASPTANHVTVHPPQGASTELVLAQGDLGRAPITHGITVVTSPTATPAWIVSAPHPYLTLTDDDGGFVLPAVPAGRYRLRVLHPPPLMSWSGDARPAPMLETVQEVLVRSGRVTETELTLPVR